MGVSIGLDIGEVSNGVAVVDTTTRELLHAEVCDVARLIEQVESLKKENISIVGIEKFVLYPWMAETQAWKNFKNIELIGIVKYLLSQKEIPYIEIKAVQSKKVYSKARLKRLEYVVQNDPHDHKRDALSIALYAADRLRGDSNRIVRLSYTEAYALSGRRG